MSASWQPLSARIDPGFLAFRYGEHVGISVTSRRAERRWFVRRGRMPMRMAQSATVIGGYGRFTLNAILPGDADEFSTRASVRRLVLFVAHPMGVVAAS